MGAPSQAEVHNYTDLVSALVQKGMDGFTSEYGTKSNTSLWDMIDASGDPAVESALGSYALTVDEQSLPENTKTWLTTILNRSGLTAFGTALQTHVMSAAGGSYASLEAYLADKSAVVHPLFAEVMRSVNGEGTFTASSDVTTVFSPSYGAIRGARVYQGADGALADETTDAGSAATADVTLFATNGHKLYVGSPHKFNYLVVALSTLATSSIFDPSAIVKYWNGNAWTAVSGLTDNSAGLTKNDYMTWTLPTDWVRSYKDAGSTVLGDKTRYYYICIERTQAVVVTPPVGTCISIVPQPVLNSSSAHMGVPQPPLAIARITGVDTVSVTSIASVAYARFVEPAIVLRALTPIGVNVTPTVGYVDQGGNDAVSTPGAWSSIDALDTYSVVLAGGDTGVRSIRTTAWVVTTAATEGVFSVEVLPLRTPAI